MLFAAGLVFSVTLLYYNFAQRSLQEITAVELGAIASEKLAQLEMILHERNRLLASLSKSLEITKNLSRIAQDTHSHSLVQAALSARLEEGGPFVKLSVLGADNGKVIASTSPGDVGKAINNQPFFINGKKDVFVQVAYQNAPEPSPEQSSALPSMAKTEQRPAAHSLPPRRSAAECGNYYDPRKDTAQDQSAHATGAENNRTTSGLLPQSVEHDQFPAPCT